MTEHIQQYYIEEKALAIPASIAAVIFLLMGSLLFFRFSDNPLSKGMGIGFLVIFVLVGAIALSAFIFNSKKLEEVQNLKSEPALSLQQKEIKRMDKVMNGTFQYAFITFAVLMALAMSIILFSKNDFWKGIGISLMILVALVTISDSFSMQRNGQYYEKIKKLKL